MERKLLPTSTTAAGAASATSSTTTTTTTTTTTGRVLLLVHQQFYGSGGACAGVLILLSPTICIGDWFFERNVKKYCTAFFTISTPKHSMTSFILSHVPNRTYASVISQTPRQPEF